MFAQERMYLQFQSLVILMSFLTKSERGETAFFDSAFFLMVKGWERMQKVI